MKKSFPVGCPLVTVRYFQSSCRVMLTALPAELCFSIFNYIPLSRLIIWQTANADIAAYSSMPV